jgi:hypothetical protein
MPPFRPGRRLTLRSTLLAAVAAIAIPLSAAAKDVPPTPAGAQKLSAIFAAYLGKPAAGAPPAVSVTPEGGHYTVAISLGSFAAPLEQSGFSMDPAVMKYALTEQDDGTWHVTSAELPPIAAHSKDGSIAYNFTNYAFDGIFDPALATFKSAQGGVDKMTAQVQAPALQETIASGPIHATLGATPAANGAISAVAHEEIADLSVAASVTPEAGKPGADAKPVSFKFRLAKAIVDLGLDGMSIRKALDLWAFVVAHPGRAEIAANEPAFKDLLRALMPTAAKGSEKIEAQNIAVDAQQGSFGLANAKFSLAAAIGQGPKGSVEYHLAMDGLALPPGLVPPPMHDLAPTAIDFGIRASGFDFAAGADEAINDMHFAGDGPVIAQADGPKILARIKGAAPLVIELLPSHVAAPQVDLTLEGQAHLEGVRPSGSLKVHARNFDNTIAALKGAGPMATPQMIGFLALAKGLGKADGDGLTWVAEYGADGSIKVNGLPLGKSP